MKMLKAVVIHGIMEQQKLHRLNRLMKLDQLTLCFFFINSFKGVI